MDRPARSRSPPCAESPPAAGREMPRASTMPSATTRETTPSPNRTCATPPTSVATAAARRIRRRRMRAAVRDSTPCSRAPDPPKGSGGMTCLGRADLHARPANPGFDREQHERERPAPPRVRQSERAGRRRLRGSRVASPCRKVRVRVRHDFGVMAGDRCGTHGQDHRPEDGCGALGRGRDRPWPPRAFPARLRWSRAHGSRPAACSHARPAPRGPSTARARRIVRTSDLGRRRI